MGSRTKLICALVMSLAVAAPLLNADPAVDPYKWSVMPLPALAIAPETGIGYGVAALFTGSPASLSLTGKTDSAVSSILYTQKSQLEFDLVVEKYFGTGDWFLNAEPLFNKNPSFFWGIGPDTKSSSKENFSYTEGGLITSFLKEISPRLFIGPYYRLLVYDVTASQAGGIISSGTVPGGDGGVLSAFGMRFLLDKRDRRYCTSAGYFLDLKAALMGRVIGASSNSYIFEGDFRNYYTLFPENILAYNVVARFTGYGMPLRGIPRLGGLYLMRGYYEGRYMDYDYITAQVEYRFPLFWTFRGAVYAAAGQVAPQLNYFKTDGLKLSYGFGLHWKPFDFMDAPLRFDLAFADIGPQLYLDLQEAF